MDTLKDGSFLPRISKEERERIAKRETMAIRISNIANLIRFAAKFYASVMSGSLAIIASTVDSLLDPLSCFIMWFTALSMQTPNPYKYPMGKRRMQPLCFSKICAGGILQLAWLCFRWSCLIGGSHTSCNNLDYLWPCHREAMEARVGGGEAVMANEGADISRTKSQFESTGQYQHVMLSVPIAVAETCDTSVCTISPICSTPNCPLGLFRKPKDVFFNDITSNMRRAFYQITCPLFSA